MSFVDAGGCVRRRRAGDPRVFAEFAGLRGSTPAPFPRIAYREAMLKYGTDKPDLRNPIEIADVTEAVRGSGFKVFAGAVEKGAVVRAVPAPEAAAGRAASSIRSANVRQELGRPGLAGSLLERRRAEGADRQVPRRRTAASSCGRRPASRRATRVFFVCDKREDGAEAAGLCARASGTSSTWSSRTATGSAGSSTFRCTNGTRRPSRSTSRHNPFSMPQGGLEALDTRIR